MFASCERIAQVEGVGPRQQRGELNNQRSCRKRVMTCCVTLCHDLSRDHRVSPASAVRFRSSTAARAMGTSAAMIKTANLRSIAEYGNAMGVANNMSNNSNPRSGSGI